MVTLWYSKFLTRGGTIASEYSDDVDYVLNTNTRSRNGLPKYFNNDIQWVDIRWVDDCIEAGAILPSKRVVSPVKKSNQIAKVVEKDILVPKSNDHLIQELVNRMNYHKFKKDKFKVLAYRKAIQSISDSSQIITSGKQAMSLPHVGKSIADKIDEILRSGKLSIPPTEEIDRIVNLFKGIYGVGDSIAQKWYQMGWRTLDDVNNHKEDLNHDQKIGLKYYNEINSKITREEMIQLEKVVSAAIRKIDDGFLVHLVGSFRREEEECGDADFIVSHPDSKWLSRNSFPGILRQMEESGLEVIHLTNLATEHTFYKGLCKLNLPGSIFRRIDIVMVPENEFGAALIQWTGNDLFNRRLRSLAKAKGMKLNQHGLYVVEDDGNLSRIAGRTEREVFDALGEPWREPKDRLL